MPDTGAPWNIPYIEPTDLVRNYPVANELMADAIAAGLTAAGSPGIGSNVVQGVLDDVFSLSATATFTDITDLEVTITPSSATSKVLLIAELGQIGGAVAASMQFRFTRNGTAVGVGAAEGGRAQASFRQVRITADQNFGSGMTFLDAPATASAVTYKLQMVTETNGFINRGDTDNNLFIRGHTISTLTAIEVAA